MSIAGSSSGDACKIARSSWTWTSSPQSVGGPRAGETGGGSSGSRRCVRIFRIGPGSRTGCPQQPEVAKSAKAKDGFALVKQPERHQPDVTATVRALKWKLLPHPGHEFRPRDPRRVMRAWLVMCVAAASRAVSVVPMPAGHVLAPLTYIPDRERRDGFSQPVVRREHPVIAMPVLPRRRHEIGEPVEKLKRREVDDAIGPRPRGLAAATGSDPVGRLMSRQHVADADDAAVGVADHGEPEREVATQRPSVLPSGCRGTCGRLRRWLLHPP